METDLRAVIDFRYRGGLPLVITTQFRPDTLATRHVGGNPAREEVCASIVRRISERSRSFRFSRGRKHRPVRLSCKELAAAIGCLPTYISAMERASCIHDQASERRFRNVRT